MKMMMMTRDEREGRGIFVLGGKLRLDRVATATNSLQDSQISKTISDCLRKTAESAQSDKIEPGVGPAQQHRMKGELKYCK